MGWDEIETTEDPRLTHFRITLAAALTACVEQRGATNQGAAMIYAFACGGVREAFLDENRDDATQDEMLRLMHDAGPAPHTTN